MSEETLDLSIKLAGSTKRPMLYEKGFAFWQRVRLIN